MLNTTNDGHKPLNEEIVKALNASLIFLERVSKEFKIQTMLDEVRKLALNISNRDSCIEEKVTQIKHQALSIESVSSISSYAAS